MIRLPSRTTKGDQSGPRSTTASCSRSAVSLALAPVLTLMSDAAFLGEEFQLPVLDVGDRREQAAVDLVQG